MSDPRSTWQWRRLSRQLCASATHCTRCGHALDTTRPNGRRYPTVDHITPLIHGGALLDPANLRVVCNSCNASMGATVGNRMRRRTERPRPVWRSRAW